MKSKKITLDTNLWISFLITKDYSFLDGYIENGKAILFFSEELIENFKRCQKAKTSKILRIKTLNTCSNFQKFWEFDKSNFQIELCRDYEDNFI